MLTAPEPDSRRKKAWVALLTVTTGVGASLAVVLLSATASATDALQPLAPVSPPGQLVGSQSLAVDTRGRGALVVWNAREGAVTRVFARRLDITGRPVGEPIPLSEQGKEALSPQVTFNSRSREYFVAWPVERTPSQAFLRARRVSVEGAPIGAEFAIDGVVSITGGPIALASGARRGQVALVVRNSRSRIEAYLLGRTGSPIKRTTLSRRSGCGFPSVAHRARQDEFMVGWACNLPDETSRPQTHYVRRLSSSGRARSGEIAVLTPRYTQRGTGQGALAYDAKADRFLFAGQARRRIRTRLIAGSGRPLGPVRSLRRVSVGNEALGPTLSFDPRKRSFVVVWLAFPRGMSDPGFFLARVDQRGLNPRGASRLLFQAPLREFSPFPSVAATDAPSGFLAAFTSFSRGILVQGLAPR